MANAIITPVVTYKRQPMIANGDLCNPNTGKPFGDLMVDQYNRWTRLLNRTHYHVGRQEILESRNSFFKWCMASQEANITYAAQLSEVPA